MLSKEFRWIIEDLYKLRIDGLKTTRLTACGILFSIGFVFYTLYRTLPNNKEWYCTWAAIYFIVGVLLVIYFEFKMKRLTKEFNNKMKEYVLSDEDFVKDMEKIEELSKIKKKTTKKKSK